MSTLEYTIYGLKRGWKVSRTFVFAGAFAAAIVSGIFADVAGSTARKAAVLALFAVWALLFGVKAHRRFFTEFRARAASDRADLELGLLLVLATHAGVQMFGGLGSQAYPIVLVLVAFLVVYTSQWVGMTLMAFTVGIEMAMVTASPSAGSHSLATIHAVFIVMFSLINLAFTRVEVRRMRTKARRQAEKAKIALANDARDFRLTSATSDRMTATSRTEEEARLSMCAVSEVRRSMFHHVDLLKRTMKLHTCAVFWRSGESLRMLECVSDSDDISSRELAGKEGVIGGVIQSNRPLLLKALRPGFPGIPYYDNGSAITDFLGVPIMEGAAVRGVLCADRKGDVPFTEAERDVLCSAVDSVMQNVSNERVFAQLQRAKSEQGKLLRASESLTKALNENDVVQAALEAAAQIAHYDLAVVAFVDQAGGVEVKMARGEGAEQLAGLKVGRTASLTGAVIKNRHYLPYKGQFDAGTQVVFSKKTQKVFAAMKSALIMPLIAGDAVLGTLTLAAREPAAFNEEIRTTLQVMTNQLGIGLQNADMVRKLEEMATTDGLTGLPNHRSFQEELTRQLAQSNRFASETSIILCDVDKFKLVNDNFGHPVGDIVLKALGETLRRNVVRDTDMPARYGGEEFIIICGGTGTEGARQLGDRIRKDLESQVFKTEKGELRCTISMGVATFPVHARSKEDLVERADLALYAAKEGGRNQVRVWKKEYVK